MRKYLILLPLLCFSTVIKAQTDTVASKISKLPYKHVDAVAKFAQGDFNDYISRTLQYNHAVENSIKGQIVLLMSIGADGSISHVVILKSLSPVIDQEVVKVVNASPKWQPAMLNGQKVSMDMVLNIAIAIKGSKAIAPFDASVRPSDAKVKPGVLLTRAIQPTPLQAIKTNPPVTKKIVSPPISQAKPATATKTTLSATKKPVKPVAGKIAVVKKMPIQMTVKKQTPVIAKKAPLLLVKKPAAVVPKKVAPPVIKKPLPAVAKLPPPVVKKPIPPVVKKPAPPKVIAPIVKKAPPIVKKPVPAVAKIMPPPVKKPTLLIAKTAPANIKKDVAPVAKKVVPLPVRKPAVKAAAPLVKSPVQPVVKKAIPLIKKTEPLIAKNEKAAVAKKPKRKIMKQDLFNPSSRGAMFPGGGLPAFFKYLSENIVYPPGAKKANIEGKVLLSFVVEENGSINDVEIISSPSEDLGQEAIRVLLASPKWKPAEQNGRKVPVSYQIPIKFTLSDKATN